MRSAHVPFVFANVVSQDQRLFTALNAQDWTTFKVLLAGGADLGQRDSQGRPLILALVRALPHLDLLIDFISTQAPAKRGVLLSQHDEKGQSSLHHAAEAGNLDIIPWLIEQGLDVNEQDKYGYTPLHQATKSLQFEKTIACLLEHKAEVHRINLNGDNPIQYALGLGLVEQAMVMTRVLLEFVGLSSLSQFSLLSLFQTWYSAYAMNEVVDYKSFQRKQLDSVYDQIGKMIQTVPSQDPTFPLLLFMESEVVLSQHRFLEAIGYAAAGVLHAHKESKLLLENQRVRILIQFRQTNLKCWDELVFPSFSDCFCTVPAHTPVTIAILMNSLRIHRARLKHLLSTGESIKTLLEANTIFFQELTTVLFKIALSFAYSPDQEHPSYAVLTMGSLSQQEMAPFSDLEFALLIPTNETHFFFDPVIQCMELLVVALGETPLTVGSTTLNPTGFEFDRGGNTPKAAEFIGTPRDLAAHQLDCTESNAILRHVLRGASFLLGDTNLFKQYQLLLQKNLQARAQPEALALFTNSLAEFSPAHFGIRKEKVGVPKFRVKTELYRLPAHAIQGLCLYHGLWVQGSFERIKLLHAKGHLSRVNAHALNELMEGVLRLRFQTHLHYETEREDLFHPEQKSSLPLPHEGLFWLDTDLQNQLCTFYVTLFSLELGLQDFIAGKMNFFSQTSLVPAEISLTPFLQARVHERLLLPERALGFYKVALQVAPKDWSLQLAYQCFAGRLQEQLQTERDTLFCKGQTFTYQLVHALQAAWVPPGDYASRGHTLPSLWMDDFLKALESHPQKSEIEMCLGNMPTWKTNWSLALSQILPSQSSSGLQYDNEVLTRHKEESLASLSQMYNCALRENLAPHQRAGVLSAFLPVLARRIQLLDQKLEEHSQLSRRAIQNTVNTLLQHENKPDVYLQVYRQTQPALRHLFREALISPQHKVELSFVESLLKLLNQEPDESGQRQNWMTHKSGWQETLRALVTTQPGTSKTYNLASPLLSGSFVLKPDIQAELLDAQGEFIQRDYKGVRHNVVRLALNRGRRQAETVYLKAFPEMPGMSYLIEQLHERLIGHGTCLSELVKLERPGKDSIPILISEEISGPTLHDVLKESPEMLNCLDARCFTELVWLAILTNPEDGLPTNYIVHTPPGESPTLISIDHDHALFPSFALDQRDDGESKSDAVVIVTAQPKLKMQLQIKTILFCLDLMRNKINTDARQAFLRLNPQKVLSAVLRRTQEQNAWYQQLFTPTEIQAFHQTPEKSRFRSLQRDQVCTIPIPLKTGDTIKIYQKLIKLQRFIGQFPQATLLQCLIHCEPRAGLLYARAMDEYDHPLDRLLNLGRYPTNVHGQMITKSRAAQSLKLQSQDLARESYASLADLTPEQGLAELDIMTQQAAELDFIRCEVQVGNFEQFSQLKASFHKAWIVSGAPEIGDARIDWKKLTETQQHRLLQHLEGVPFEKLYLGDCTVLTRSTLESLLKCSPDIQELDLSGHSGVNDTWLLRIAPGAQSLRSLILRGLPNLANIRNIQSSFPHLEYLVVSDNPILQTLCMNAPRLRFLQARNSPQLLSVETSSCELREADLRNTPLLTRSGLEGRLATCEGLAQLNRLQLSGSGVTEYRVLEIFPMLLVYSDQTDMYFETLSLFTRYLRENWQSLLPSGDLRARLGMMLNLGFRRTPALTTLMSLATGENSWWVRRTLRKCFKTATPVERAQILTKLQPFETTFVKCFAPATTDERGRILPRLLRWMADENLSNLDENSFRAMAKLYRVGNLEQQVQILPILLSRVITDHRAAPALGECFKIAVPEERAKMLSKLLERAKEEVHGDRFCGAAQALGECFATSNSQERALILPLFLQQAAMETQGCRAARVLGKCFKSATTTERGKILELLLKQATEDIEDRAAVVLSECFKSATAHERNQILSVLLELPVPRVLGECFKTASPGERNRILPVLLNRVGDGSSDIAHIVGDCLKEVASVDLGTLYPMLLRWMDHANSSVRRTAALTLGKYFQVATLSERAEIMYSLTSGDWLTKLAVVPALGSCFTVATTEERSQLLPILLNWAEVDAGSGAFQVLEKCICSASQQERDKILPILLKTVCNQSWSCSERVLPMHALAKFFRNASTTERSQILPVLLKQPEGDAQHLTAVPLVLAKCFKTATSDERNQITAIFLVWAALPNSKACNAVHLIFQYFGQKSLSSSTARAILRSFAPWTQKQNHHVRRTLIESLLNWTESTFTFSILPEFLDVLRVCLKDHDTKVKSRAQIAMLQLQLRFNLENTLQQIAQQRTLQEKDKQKFFPPSLLGRRQVLPPIVVDLSLPEPLQQPVQTFEEQSRQLTQQEEAALEQLLDQLPSQLRPRVQTLLAEHEQILISHQKHMMELLETVQSSFQNVAVAASQEQDRYRSEFEAAERLLANQEHKMLASFEEELTKMPGLDIPHVLKLQAFFFDQQKAFQKERAQQEARLWETWHRQLRESQSTEAKQSSASTSMLDSSDLQTRLDKVEAHQRSLLQAFAGQQRQLEEQKTLRGDPELGAFYNTLRCKLEEIFLAFKTLASGLVKREGDKLDFIPQGVKLLGSLIPLPMIKPITQAISAVLQVGIDRVVHERNQQRSQLVVSVLEMTNLVETVARQLTWRYELQLKALSVEGAATLAECVVIRMLEGVPDRVQNSDRLAQELIAAVYKRKAKPSIFAWFQDRIIPKKQASNKPWTEADILFKPGIAVYERHDRASFYRGGAQQDREFVLDFGYRLGTAEEAKNWEWIKTTEIPKFPEGRLAIKFLLPSSEETM